MNATHPPIHPQFLRAPAPPRESSLCASVVNPSDPIRKFIIVRDAAGREHPVIFSRDLVHRTMVPPGFNPVSAGFLLIAGGRLKVLEAFESSSLNLKPRPQDEALLTSFMSHNH